MTLTTAPDPTQPGPYWEGLEPETAALVPVAQPEAITRWEALAHQIAQASQQAKTKKFDYRTSVDNKAARAWIAHLRRLAGSIERHRKDAKAVHLERGREVDSTAKTLKSAVQDLIDPHQRELDAIAAEEEYRIAQHRGTLGRIATLVEGVTTSAEAQARLQQLAAINTSGLEEFRAAGEARHAEAEAQLLSLLDTLRQQEADQAELKALRADRAARERAERDERIRQEAVEAERQQAAEAAQRAEAARQAAEAFRIQQTEKARRLRRAAFRDELTAAIEQLKPSELAELIISGELHPAITIDWSQV